ncbi:hypothetical protein C8J57DRAFT_1174469 [Mycena rebaudengoi]|nr:hypothetical protein C8J57DRAFT_1174469 [Mycena rebaudengoi]
MPLFSNSTGIHISGGNFYDLTMRPGIHILHRSVALDAMYDSADSYPQPRCHPETRVEMLKKLFKWSTESKWAESRWSLESRSIVETVREGLPVIWLHGPAGAGKSAIMRTLSERLADAGCLGGTFFFKRGHATRGNAQTLFATLAYQLSLHISQMKLAISQAVEENPSVVARSMPVQMQKLILNPCRSLDNLEPPVIIIDGLDECDGHLVQQDILRLIAQSISMDAPPLKFLIASRPEPHIHEIFKDPLFKDLYHSFDVMQSFKDVEKYLCDEFSRIHREHHETMGSIAGPWPSKRVIDQLVHKSSGYFIYATTIIKFVDDRNFRPTERLEILKQESHSESPFGALDQLYTQILSAVPIHWPLIPILRALDFCEFGLTPTGVEQLLELNPGDVRLALRNLHCLFEVPKEDDVIGVHHASLQDFLNDATRAGTFYVGDPEYQVDIARHVLKALSYKCDDTSINRVGPVAL